MPRPYAALAPLDAIRAERAYQTEKWGGRNHDLYLDFADWGLILTREVGEAMQALGAVHWPEDHPEMTYDERLLDLRSELIQVAAVAVAMIEVVDQVDEQTVFD